MVSAQRPEALNQEALNRQALNQRQAAAGGQGHEKSRIEFPLVPLGRRSSPFKRLRKISIVIAQGEKMKRAMITAAVGFTTAFFQTITYAEVDAKWAQTKLRETECLTCHYINGKKFGPSFQAVSKKYRGKNPDDIIAAWGALRVHSGVRTQISDQDLKSVLEWVLTLRPGSARDLR